MTATGQGANPTHTPNRLIHEASPYLQQHAGNPVDWYPWSGEALTRAKTEDKPIFLSVGYSACHWCHVMERESFENPEIATVMNEHFINIKVDREERPDLDRIYQSICQMVTRSGGWPLSVFLTPDLKPFYVGTYFPPRDRYGRPGFARLLAGIADVWATKRGDALKVADQWTEHLQDLDVVPPAREGAGTADRSLITTAVAELKDHVDREHGGFGGAPKFPNAENLELLLREHRATGDTDALDLTLLTLLKMAAGGIYDQLGGGFHRYSVDDHWAVPHFEKMLYDNALLTTVYLHAYQVTGDLTCERVVRETLNYVQREMTCAEGAFYSTQDADSEGEEGKFFVWTPDEIKSVLGEANGELACRYFGVTPSGNFEHGTTVLHLAMTAAEAGAPLGIASADAARRLTVAKQQLWAHREEREKPFRDEKILTAWNGLMISAFAQAAQVFGDPDYVVSARRAADFILARLVTPEGALLRRYKRVGAPAADSAHNGAHGRAAAAHAGIDGTLEDYAYFAAALLDLYETTFEEQYLLEAVRLTQETVQRFGDAAHAGFYLTAAGAPDLITRPREITDSSMPAPNSIAALNLLRCHPYTGNDDLRAMSERILQRYDGIMRNHAWGLASLLSALDFFLSGGVEITVIADADDPAARDWLQRIRRIYMPNRILSRVEPSRLAVGTSRAQATELPPIWAGKRPQNGSPTVYICKNFACSPPVTDWAEAEKWL